MVDIYFLADKRNLRWCYCCPHDEATMKLHCNTTCVLQRLTIMLADQEAHKIINRHILLINHFIGIASNTFKIVDMSYITVILEYLCRELEDENWYREPLFSLLYLIQSPPVIYRFSHNVEHAQDLTNYFTTLAKCYSNLKDQDTRSLVISAINNMIGLKREPDIVSQEACIQALEKSRLAHVFSKTLAMITNKIYMQDIVDLFNNLTTVSEEMIYSLYEEDCVNRLLCSIPLLLDEPNLHHHLHRTAFLLLRILTTVITSKNHHSTPLTLSDQAQSNLRTWLQKEVVHGQKIRRNIVFSVTLAIIYSQKVIKFSCPQMFEDILLMGLSPKIVWENSWMKNVELTSDPLDFEFKKMVLIAAYELFDYCLTKIMSEKLECAAGLSQLFDLALWSEKENNVIRMICLHLVPRLAIYQPQEIIKYDLLSKMFCQNGKLNHKKDCDDIFFYLIQSIYSLSLNDSLSVYFREKNFIPALIEYCETIVEMSAWSVRVQLVLEYTLNSIVNIASKLNLINLKSCQSGLHCSFLSTNLLKRIITPNEQDSVLDPCMIVAVVDFIWVIQINDTTNKCDFIKAGGVYLLLDALEGETQRCSVGGGSGVIIGVLSELMEEELAVAQAVTWKGKVYTNIIHLLTHLFRLTEKDKQVNRDSNACLADSEAALMGSAQANCESPLGSCFPILEMIGCLRAKIHSIISLLLKDHKDFVELSEETYRTTFRMISIQDKITLEVIKYYEYLKEGEIWQNMLSCMKQHGLAPLAGDELLLHTLTLEHIKSARHVLHLQKLYLNKQMCKEIEEEEKLYEKITASKIVEEVDKYRSMEKDLLIKNNRMRLVMKELQISSIEESANSCWKKQCFTRTYNAKNNTTMMTMGRNIIATGKRTKEPDAKKSIEVVRPAAGKSTDVVAPITKSSNLAQSPSKLTSTISFN